MISLQNAPAVLPNQARAAHWSQETKLQGEEKLTKEVALVPGHEVSPINEPSRMNIEYRWEVLIPLLVPAELLGLQPGEEGILRCTGAAPEPLC